MIMGRYRKILVAIDGSESSMHALRESFKLAVNEKSWITVTSVIPPYEGELELVGVRNIVASLRKPCEDALSRAEKFAKEERALIKTVCEEGAVYERIVDLAEAENCDLIIMGRKGASRLESALIGSVTARVIGHSRRDVLVIPNGSQVGLKNILLATDGSKYSNIAAERAVDFAKSYGGNLKVVSIVDVPAEYYAEAPKAVDNLIESAKGFVKDVKKSAEAAGVDADTFVGEGEAYEIITKLSREQKADIIIMGSHGRTGLKRLLMGSVTEKVIGHSPCPVLVIKS